jgi:hypothetical protein
MILPVVRNFKSLYHYFIRNTQIFQQTISLFPEHSTLDEEGIIPIKAIGSSSSIDVIELNISLVADQQRKCTQSSFPPPFSPFLMYYYKVQDIFKRT